MYDIEQVLLFVHTSSNDLSFVKKYIPSWTQINIKLFLYINR